MVKKPGSDPRTDADGGDRRVASVSYRVSRDLHKRFLTMSVALDVSGTDVMEWYLAELVALFEAGKVAEMSDTRRTVTLVALSSDAYTAASLRARAASQTLPEWLSDAVEARLREADAHGSEVRQAFGADVAVPIPADEWARVVAAVGEAFADGGDVVAAFFKSVPWKRVPRGTDEDALLRRCLAEIDYADAIRAMTRRTLGAS